jgi:putative FmdB family regulatory protein
VPLYEYTCSGCGAAFEHLVRARSEEAGLRCPQCGAQQIERRLSVIATPRAGTRSAAAAAPGPCGQCDQAGGACPYR